MTALPQSSAGTGGRSPVPALGQAARRGLTLAAALIAAALAVGLTATTPGGRGVGVVLAITGGLLAVRVAWVTEGDR